MENSTTTQPIIEAVPVASTNISLNSLDIISELASINASYLGISIAVILFIGGFAYFLNIKPLEKKINTRISAQEANFKKVRVETARLLRIQEATNKQRFDEFEIDIDTMLDNEFSRRDEVLKSELDARISNLSKENFVKQEFLLEKITELEKIAITNKAEVTASIVSLKNNLKDTTRRIMELEQYKYSKENKMGGFIRVVDLIDMVAKGNTDEWRLESYLDLMLEELDGAKLTSEHVSSAESVLDCIYKNEKFAKHKLVIETIREKLKSAMG